MVKRSRGDAPVTGTRRKYEICKVNAGSHIFAETASDGLRSNWKHCRAIRFHPLKIRRYLVPWGFNSPSRHQPQSPCGAQVSSFSIASTSDHVDQRHHQQYGQECRDGVLQAIHPKCAARNSHEGHNSDEGRQGMSCGASTAVLLWLRGSAFGETKMRKQNHDPDKKHTRHGSSIEQQKRIVWGEYRQQDRSDHAAGRKSRVRDGALHYGSDGQPSRRISATRQ